MVYELLLLVCGMWVWCYGVGVGYVVVGKNLVVCGGGEI